MFNNPMVVPTVRQIRIRVLLDGTPIPGARALAWTTSSHYNAATWRASFALNADAGFGAAWWDGRDTGPTLDLQVGVGQANGTVQWTSLGIGVADSATYSEDLTEIEITGRDLAALMIDQCTAQTYQNQTASEIVGSIAAGHGLSSDVTATTTPVGRFWGGDYTHQTRAQNATNTTEWDLLVRLAQIEGFDLYLDGRTLCFHPQVTNDPDPYVVRWTPATPQQPWPVSGVADFRASRNWIFAKPVTVLVKSFNSKSGATVSATASFGTSTTDTSIGGEHGTTSMRPTRRNFVRANLTQDQAQTLANTLLNDMVKHERSVSWSEPANLELSPRSMVRLEGTATGFDQNYYIDTITKTASFQDGFRMDVQAKNHSPSSDDATSEAS